MERPPPKLAPGRQVGDREDQVVNHLLGLTEALLRDLPLHFYHITNQLLKRSGPPGPSSTPLSVSLIPWVYPGGRIPNFPSARFRSHSPKWLSQIYLLFAPTLKYLPPRENVPPWQVTTPHCTRRIVTL